MNSLKYSEATDIFVLNVLDLGTNVYICLTTFRPSLIFEPGDEKDWSDRDRDWFERFDYGEVRDGKNSQIQISKRSFIKESQERGGKSRDVQDSTEPVRQVSSMTDDRDRGARDKLSGNRSQVKDSTGEKLP